MSVRNGILAVLRESVSSSILGVGSGIVIPPDPVVLSQPENVNVELGGDAQFSIVVDGTDPVMLQVEESIDGDWTELDGEISDTFTISSVELFDSSRSFRWKIVGLTTIYSDTFTISVTIPPPDPVDSVINFGTLTPAGEGEQAIDATDGVYSVGGGSFTVASNRINVTTMPAAGTYTVDGVDVTVTSAARTVATIAEIAAMWKASNGTHPANTKILVAPGAYNFYSLLTGSTFLANDWLWTAVDQDNPPLFTSSSTSTISYYASTNAGSSALEYINFYRAQSTLGSPWNVDGRDIFTIKSGATVTMMNCRVYGDFVPTAEGGRIKTKVAGLSVESGGGLIWLDSECDHLCTGVRFAGTVYAARCHIHEIYSDFVELRAGVTGTIKNCHLSGDIGDGTFLHGDYFQMQVPPHTPQTTNLLIEGCTGSPGTPWSKASTQVDYNKPDVTINTAGPHTMTVAAHHGVRAINVDPLAAGGTVTIYLPLAADEEFFTLVYRQISAGTVIFVLAGSDTSDASLTMTAKEQTRTFISNGVSHFSTLEPGYRGYLQVRTVGKTLGEMEKDLVVTSRATVAQLDYTLPPGTTAYTTTFKKDDTTAHDTTIEMPAGQTYTLRGTPGLSADLTISKSGQSYFFSRASGQSTWTVTEGTITKQAVFSNGPDDGWDGLIVRYNIFFLNSPNAFRPDDNTLLGAGVFNNSKCHNNTFLRQSPPDCNGDGVISDGDTWNTGTVGSIYVFDGVDTFRNVYCGNLVNNGPSLRKAQNVGLSAWTDAATLTPLSGILNASSASTLRPSTRDECVTAALAASGGSLVIDSGSFSYVGAVGTSATNGPYNWTTGEVNANTKAPVVASMLPVDGSTAVPTNTTIRVTFDELITLGTGNVSIRAVGGSVIESFDVESSGQLAIGDNGLTLIITPTSELPTSTDVCVRMDATAIDGYFNSFAGITGDTLNFVTGAGPLDPEMLPDPTFDTPSEWYGGTSPPGTFPASGWTVAGGLASKAAGSNFQALSAATEPAAVAGTTYIGSAKLDSKTNDTGSLRIQLVFLNGSTVLESTNANTALSGLSVGSSATYQRVAPATTNKVKLQIVATSGSAIFTLSDASLKIV